MITTYPQTNISEIRTAIQSHMGQRISIGLIEAIIDTLPSDDVVLDETVSEIVKKRGRPPMTKS
jgi:hypothetical protein